MLDEKNCQKRLNEDWDEIKVVSQTVSRPQKQQVKHNASYWLIWNLYFHLIFKFKISNSFLPEQKLLPSPVLPCEAHGKYRAFLFLPSRQACCCPLTWPRVKPLFHERTRSLKWRNKLWFLTCYADYSQHLYEHKSVGMANQPSYAVGLHPLFTVQVITKR